MTLAYQGRSCQARDKRIPRGKIYGAGRTDLSLALSRLGENADANTTRILGEFECPRCNPFPEGNRRPAPPLTMSSWSAQVLPECTCCTSCAVSAYRPGSMSRAAMSAAPGTGIAIPAPAATSRACSTLTRLGEAEHAG